VGYGSDAKRVHEILLEIASNHPLVLKNPEPFVLFSAFGESSLDFEVRVFLADVSNGIIVQNDVRFAILEAFARENIEIPFPQRDVHLKREPPSEKWPIDDDKAEAEHFELAKALKEKATPPPAPRRKRRKPDPG
jgi:small-conductance mechanosensitive channel